MNKTILTLILVILFISCRNNLNSKNSKITQENYETTKKKYFKYRKKNDWKNVRMSKINVKDFMMELKVEKENELNILSTIGQTDKNWITTTDLEYLISLIESTERAKCINRIISSFIPDPKNMTIGNQAISIIEAYRKGEPFPNELYICKTYDTEKINEILKWWKQKKGN